jgi:hypothetical protein
VLVIYTSEATPGRANEDYVAAGPSWVVLLDGATAPIGVDSGCVHDVPWLVRHLGGALSRGLAISTERPLAELLAEAIRVTSDAHADTCDLANPASPSSTVAMLRQRDDQLDYLVLADSPIVLDLGGEVQAVVDDRTAHLTDYSAAGVRAARNQPGGFWVASTKPEAAHEAVTGSVPVDSVRRAALLSDGASRYADRFALGGWGDLLDLLDQSGPCELICQVRAAERAETEIERASRRGKAHDDATAVLIRFNHDTPGGVIAPPERTGQAP